MTRQRFCNGMVEIRHRPASDLQRHVVTFDHFHDDPTFERLAFAEAFLAAHGISATHVLTRTNHWFQYPDFDQALEAVYRLTRSAKIVMTYGSSMGGYAAIRFADAVGAARVLAFSPQYSIDPTIMPEERRWAAHSRRIRFLPALNGVIRCSADVVVLFDPASPDKGHVARIDADISLRSLGIRHAGHPVGSFLSEIGVLAQTVLEGLDGRLDLTALDIACRSARRISSHYHSALSEAQPVVRKELALRLAQRAVQLGPGSPPALHFLALRLRALGRTHEAIAVYRECVALERQPAYLYMYGRILLESGVADTALEVARDLLRSFGSAPDYHYLACRALIATGRPEAAVRDLWIAIRLDPTNRHYWNAILPIARGSIRRIYRFAMRDG